MQRMRRGQQSRRATASSPALGFIVYFLLHNGSLVSRCPPAPRKKNHNVHFYLLCCYQPSHHDAEDGARRRHSAAETPRMGYCKSRGVRQTGKSSARRKGGRTDMSRLYVAQGGTLPAQRNAQNFPLPVPPQHLHPPLLGFSPSCLLVG